jgi:hypothetical protein
MMLLTAANRNALPALYSTADAENPKAIVKFLDPNGARTWFATEFDGEDTFFGLVDVGSWSERLELGYFSLSELESRKGPFGLRVERDLSFTPTPIKELQ